MSNNRDTIRNASLEIPMFSHVQSVTELGTGNAAVDACIGLMLNQLPQAWAMGLAAQGMAFAKPMHTRAWGFSY